MAIRVDREGSLRVLTMDDGLDNRFNLEFLGLFNQALDEIEEDPEARAAVVTGGPDRFFAVGIDIPWALSATLQDATDFLTGYVRLVHRCLLFPKPMVSAINGHAFAGGFFLAMTSDWRVMREDRGFLCVPEIDLPYDLPVGHVALTAMVVGTRNADYLALTGERVPGPKALALGAADELAQKDEVLPRALAAALKLSPKSIEQYARHKRNLRARVARLLLEEDLGFMVALAQKERG